MKKMIIFILFLFYSAGYSQNYIESKGSFEPDTAYVGDKIVFKLNINAPKEFKISAPDTLIAEDFINPRINKNSIDSIDVSSTHKKLIFSYDMQVLPQNSIYEAVMPPQEVLLIDDVNDTFSVFSDTVKLNIVTVTSDTTTKAADIKNVKYLSNAYLDIILLALAGLAVLILIIWILSKIKSGKRVIGKTKTEYVKPKIIKNPFIEAEKKIGLIEKNDYLSHNRFQDFYFAVSEGIREFIELYYKVPALEDTDREFILRCSKIRELKDFNEYIENWFELAEVVKFANYKPFNEENSKFFDLFKKIVEYYKEIKKQKEKEDFLLQEQNKNDSRLSDKKSKNEISLDKDKNLFKNNNDEKKEM